MSTTPFPVTPTTRNRDGSPFFVERDPASGEPLRIAGEGRRYRLSEAYSDNRVLFAAPAQFDPARPFRLVLFFHGHLSEIERTLVRELDLPGQIARSGINAVLIAPQLARDAADSSPGRWTEPGLASAFVAEAGEALRARLGGTPAAWSAAPVVLAAFSGGYRALSTAVERGGLSSRVEGIVLLDALYGDVDVFARWLRQWSQRAFLWSLSSRSTQKESEELIAALLEAGVQFERSDGPLRGARLLTVETPHVRVPLDGPPLEPLADVLRRLP
jgi:hypothetical protein